jgi:alanine racemase
VVKADAYGLGAVRVAQALAAACCDNFFVARLEEGIALRAVVPHARIIVLDGVLSDAAAALINHRLTPALNSLSDIAAWSAAAGAARTSLDSVVHVDTGINRLGLYREELAIQGPTDRDLNPPGRFRAVFQRACPPIRGPNP